MVDKPLAIPESGQPASSLFKATGAPTGWSMPDRLAKNLAIANVKDWGAKGDGVTDDYSAIQAAIDHVYANYGRYPIRGGIVFIPAGTYILNSMLEFAKTNANPETGDFQGQIWIMGAGREATILKGSSSNNWVAQTREAPDTSTSFQGMSDLTIWNAHPTPTTGGAFHVHQNGRSMRLENLRFKGFIGLQFRHDVYNTFLTNIIAECTVPIGAANSAAPGPAAGSLGLFLGQGQLVNCQTIGYDCGIMVFGVGTLTQSCRMSRCNIGMSVGGPLTPAGQNTFAWDPGILGNFFDRCKWGIVSHNSSATTIAANVFTGDEGPADAAPISNIVWSAGTASVTSVNHNIPSGTRPLLLVTNPPQWTPDGSGRQVVMCTRTGSDAFTYSLASSPGSFTSGSWNYAMEYGITIGSIATCAIFANSFAGAKHAIADFDLARDSNAWLAGSFMASMHCKYRMSNADSTGNAGFEVFTTCIPTADSPHNPMAISNVAGIYSVSEGTTRNVVNAQTVGWGGTIVGGGSGHYKCKYIAGSNSWIRVG